MQKTTLIFLQNKKAGSAWLRQIKKKCISIQFKLKHSKQKSEQKLQVEKKLCHFEFLSRISY